MSHAEYCSGRPALALAPALFGRPTGAPVPNLREVGFPAEVTGLPGLTYDVGGTAGWKQCQGFL